MLEIFCPEGLLNRVYVFVITSFLAGLGGALGSIVGNAFGKPGLWVGGVLGGLVGVAAAVAVATAGGMIGFLIAAGIAVNTLSSPVGPILSSLIPGAGVLIGSLISEKS